MKALGAICVSSHRRSGANNTEKKNHGTDLSTVRHQGLLGSDALKI